MVPGTRFRCVKYKKWWNFWSAFLNRKSPRAAGGEGIGGAHGSAMAKNAFDNVPPAAGGIAKDAASALLPTLAGPVPPGLQHLFQAVPAPALPEVSRLPAPGERCAISGASRTWLLETDARAKKSGAGFLFRVRQPGKTRGAVFVNTAKLLAFLRAAEAAEQSAEGAESA